MQLNLTDPTLLKTQSYIDGKWCDADSGAQLDVTNPSTGELVAKVADLGGVETARAIEAAERAMQSWRAKSAKERAAVLRNWYNLILANQEDLAIYHDR